MYDERFKTKHMKVGSIVECIDNTHFVACVPPKLNRAYTIRNFDEFNGCVGIRLEEIINSLHPRLNVEFGYNIKRFRELQPPMEIQKELDECIPVMIEIKNL